MAFLYLVSTILGVSVQNITKKMFTQKNGGKGVYFFGLMSSFAAMMFFVVTSSGFEWDSGLILYAVLFAVSYAAATVFGVAAVAYGSLSITSLIVSYSLMIPTVYGLVVLKDPVSVGLFPGIALLLISLFLVNHKDSSSPVNAKWIVCVCLAFAGNGLCSLFQKLQQVEFNGGFKNEFMILSLAIVVILLGITVFATEKKDVKTTFKSGWYIALAFGAANGAVNLFVMILSNIMPVSLMFPLISAGGIIITYLISKFIYKENLTKKQFIGFLIGVASVIFLNI